MRSLISLAAGSALALTLAGCGAAAPLSSTAPEPSGSSASAPAASAVATAAATPEPSGTPTPAVGTALADAPRCGDGVVLAAAMVDAGTPDAESWLEAGAATTGFEPAELLEGAAVLCAITFRFEPDGAQESVQVSTAYVRGDGVGAAVEAWATSKGYTPVDESEHPTYVLGDDTAPEGSVQAIRLDAESLGENDVAWHAQVSGFALEATDWAVTRTGPLP